MTKYGQAKGSMQLLDSTAQEMAGKVGVPWQPGMMTGNTPQAAAYQKQLGDAYLHQAVNATSNPRDALRYYHGGPGYAGTNDVIGRRYADGILGRMGG